ncbi:MAG: transglycosylase domain-containing protein [Acidobacteriota bacterium]
MSNPRKKPMKNSTSLITSRGFFWTIAFIVGCIAIGITFGATLHVPDWDPEKLQTSEAYNPIQVPLSEVPQDLINAFLATEDRAFYEHQGINPARMAKALFIDILSGSKAQGASTITQQLARNAFLTQEKTWTRKIQEISLALQLEHRYSKEQIMHFYLNRIYFGAGAWGVGAAAKTYFGKDVKNLSLPECALLAGLVKAPSGYSPFVHPDKAKSRQREVLINMLECGFITQGEATKAYRQPLYYVR